VLGLISFFLLCIPCAHGQLELTKAELGHVKEENHRLRNLLSDANAKYHSLHAHLVAMMRQQRNGHRGLALAGVPPIHEVGESHQRKKQNESVPQEKSRKLINWFTSAAA
jgi:hypothetical protein